MAAHGEPDAKRVKTKVQIFPDRDANRVAAMADHKEMPKSRVSLRPQPPVVSPHSSTAAAEPKICVFVTSSEDACAAVVHHLVHHHKLGPSAGQEHAYIDRRACKTVFYLPLISRRGDRCEDVFVAQSAEDTAQSMEAMMDAILSPLTDQKPGARPLFILVGLCAGSKRVHLGDVVIVHSATDLDTLEKHSGSDTVSGFMQKMASVGATEEPKRFLRPSDFPTQRSEYDMVMRWLFTSDRRPTDLTENNTLFIEEANAEWLTEHRHTLTTIDTHIIAAKKRGDVTAKNVLSPAMHAKILLGMMTVGDFPIKPFYRKPDIMFKHGFSHPIATSNGERGIECPVFAQIASINTYADTVDVVTAAFYKATAVKQDAILCTAVHVVGSCIDGDVATAQMKEYYNAVAAAVAVECVFEEISKPSHLLS